MHKETITYTDYNDVERTEDFYFNLTQAELLDLETGVTGGYTAMINKIIAAQDTPTLMEVFRKLLLMSYGEKSADGRQFVKNDELTTAFKQTEAYSILYVKLATDDKAASAFIEGIIPAKLRDEYKEVTKKGKTTNGTKVAKLTKQD